MTVDDAGTIRRLNDIRDVIQGDRCCEQITRRTACACRGRISSTSYDVVAEQETPNG
jgi:hypothetical protein